MIFAIFDLYPAKEQAKGLLSKRVTGIFTHFLQKTTYKIPLKGILDSFNIKFTLKRKYENFRAGKDAGLFSERRNGMHAETEASPAGIMARPVRTHACQKGMNKEFA